MSEDLQNSKNDALKKALIVTKRNACHLNVIEHSYDYFK